MNCKNTRRGYTHCCSLLTQWSKGFTLIEILVVVLIIGILGAIALPQYQRAVLKSRYSGMMPIAKALAEANEVFYLEHGNYSENPSDLLVAGRDKNAGAYPDGTRVLMYDEDGLSYVRVMNDNVPNARYLVYQKHSENFPDTTQCEASDDRANELCVALGGQLIEEGNSSGESEWTAYLLSGRYGTGDQFVVNPGGNDGDEPGAGDEPGTNTDPETPSKPTCGGVEQPDDIEPTETNPATGTATCVNGKWVYQWTGGKVYDTDYSSATVVCEGDSEYSCAGAEFKGKFDECSAERKDSCAGSTFSGYGAFCSGYVSNGCTGSTFSGEGATCEGRASNSCVDSIFSGSRSSCDGLSANACADSTFSGSRSYCVGEDAKACAGSTFSGMKSRCQGQFANACADTNIQAGAFCDAIEPGGCDGAKYGEDPTGQRSGMGVCDNYKGLCPNGAPIMGEWSGNNSTGSYTIKSWKGGYCDPNLMVSGKCPSGSPKQGGGCWDGNGGTEAC